MTATIWGDAACTIDGAGRVLWAKNIHDPWQTASTMKLLAAITARDWIPDLNAPIAPPAENLADSTLVAGDIISWGDMIHASLIPSDNGAARTVADQSHPDGTAALVAAMSAKGTALGWSGHVIADAVGGGTAASGRNRLSAWQLCSLIKHIHDVDPWLYAAAGRGYAEGYLFPVWGSARVGFISLRHSFNVNRSESIPEFESGKTGTGNPAQQHAVWGWTHEGQRYFSSVVDSRARYEDARTMMDDVIAATTRRRIVAGIV